MSNPGNLNLSITRANAKIYIARPLGGGDNQDAIAMAEEILLRAFNDWQSEKDWEFLLKDDISSFTVDSCVLASGNPVVSAPVASAFDGVNIGVTATGTNIPANTTVSSYTRGTDGSIDTITLSQNPTASPTITITFGGTLPVRSGVSDYNLPTDFWKHYGVRLTSNLKWPLTFVRPREWNRTTLDQTIAGPPEFYTIFNPTSAVSQNKGSYRLRLYPVPSTDDVIRIDYYRKFSPLADPLDMNGEYLYKFLDYCRSLLIITKRGFDNPDLAVADAQRAFEKAKQSDENVTEDHDIRLISQWENYNDGLFYLDNFYWS